MHTCSLSPPLITASIETRTRSNIISMYKKYKSNSMHFSYASFIKSKRCDLECIELVRLLSTIEQRKKEKRASCADGMAARANRFLLPFLDIHSIFQTFQTHISPFFGPCTVATPVPSSLVSSDDTQTLTRCLGR